MTSSVIVIFDLDETLGQFVQLGYFHQAITNYFGKQPTKKEFFELLDNYDKYFRPHIFNILDYVKVKKKKNKNLKVLIYSNNQFGYKWINHIKDYIHQRLQYDLFDIVIGPYKIGKQVYEPLRTSNKKQFSDLIKFIKCNDDTKIMFLDDTFFVGMNHPSIFYVLIEKYNFQYKLHDLINMYIRMRNIKDSDTFKSYIIEYMKNIRYNEVKHTIHKGDIRMSEDIMEYLKMFFNKNLKPRTLKRKTKKMNKTRKNK